MPGSRSPLSRSRFARNVAAFVKSEPFADFCAAPIIRESFPAATVPAIVPTLSWAAPPSPRFDLAVAAVMSDRFADFCAAPDNPGIIPCRYGSGSGSDIARSGIPGIRDRRHRLLARVIHAIKQIGNRLSSLLDEFSGRAIEQSNTVVRSGGRARHFGVERRQLRGGNWFIGVRCIVRIAKSNLSSSSPRADWQRFQCAR